MHKQAFLLSLSFFLFCFAKAHSFDVSSDGNTVVVHEAHSDRLYVYNMATNKKSEIAIGAGSNDRVQLFADSLVTVHYTFAEDKTVLYSLTTGKRVYASPEHCFANAAKTALYWIDRNWTLHQCKLPGLGSTMPPLKLQAEKDSHPSGYFLFSGNGSRIAVMYHQYEKGFVGVFDQHNGKLVNRFRGFECCQTFNNDQMDLHLFGMNADGTLLAAGNENAATIFAVNKGTEATRLKHHTPEWLESGDAAFSSDGKMVYILSRQKIYAVNTRTFRVKDSLVVEGKTTSYGTPPVHILMEDFGWRKLFVANGYLMVLCEPANLQKDNKPFILRQEIGGIDKRPTKLFYR